MGRTVSAPVKSEPQIPNLPKEESAWDRFTKKVSECWHSCFGTGKLKKGGSVVKAKFPQVARASRFAAHWDVKSVKDRIREQNPPVVIPVIAPPITPSPVVKKPVALVPPKKEPVKVSASVEPTKVVRRHAINLHKDFTVQIVHEDMLKQPDIEVIVNAANLHLGGGGGIDGGIHAAGGNGKGCYRERHRALKDKHAGKDFKEGDSLLIDDVMINGMKKDVCVVAGPTKPSGLQTYEEQNLKLRNCYMNSLLLAHSRNKKSIGFPAISTGIFKYPKEHAAETALQVFKDFIKENPDSTVKEIYLFCFDPNSPNDTAAQAADWNYYKQAAEKLSISVGE